MKEYGKETYFEDNVTLPYATGKGIKLGSVDDQRSDFGWRGDFHPVIVRGTAGATSPLVYADPVWSRLGSTSFWGYKFALNALYWDSFRIPHDVLPGTQIYFAANWINGGISSPLNRGYVTWEFEYAFAKGHSQAAFDFAHATSPLTNSGTVRATAQMPVTQYTLHTTVTSAVTVPALTEPGGVIHVRVKRVNNLTSPLNNATNDVLLLAAGYQYKTTNVGTRQRDPGYFDLD